VELGVGSRETGHVAVMRQYRDLAAPHPRQGSLEEHQAILLAIVTRNPESAIAAMRLHVSTARRMLALR
jgi:DNA-binding GntR family transcriptional regulator